MELIFEVLFQFLGEILVQFGAELLLELGLHSVGDTFKKPRNPVLSGIGFALWGTLAGALSLLLFPHSLVTNIAYRKANVIVTPLVAGAAMMLIGRLRDRRGSGLVKLDRFGYAFVFALSMAVVRYFATA